MKDKLLSIFKFVLAILLFPLMISTTGAFWNNLCFVGAGISSAFGWGVASYLILHILLFEPVEVFDKGKKISEKALGVFSPLFKVTGYCVPLFTILSFIFYVLASHFWKGIELLPFFTFLAAFTFAMHIALTARALRKKTPGVLKENYLFSIFFVYLVNIVILAAAFNFLTQAFSFLDFYQNSVLSAKSIYVTVFTQLFVVSR
ncbi:MAG: hypothetical protein ABIC68_05950 [Candidatus Omnitrophota bacterium]